MSKRIVVVLAVLGAVTLAGCTSELEPDDFRVGMSRQEILAEFGEPDGQQALVKSESQVWGPIETFWSSVPPGSRIEIWSYELASGRVELYFLDGSPEVRATGFAPKGAVF